MSCGTLRKQFTKPSEPVAAPPSTCHCLCQKLQNSLEIVGFPGVVVAVSDGAAGGHPEEFALLALVRARRPEVLVTHADGLDEDIVMLISHTICNN